MQARNLVGLWVTVAGRPALQDVADVHVFASKVGGGEQLFEELAGLAHERPALLVLVGARRLPDEHHFRIQRPFARHRILASASKHAASATANASVQLLDEFGARLRHLSGPT